MGLANESINYSNSTETEDFDESTGYSRIKTSEQLKQHSASPMYPILYIAFLFVL